AKRLEALDLRWCVHDFDAPTEVERFEALGRAIGYGDLYVKRDDTSARPYGGNKPRKLEYLLGEAMRQGAGGVVTMGGIGTNHGLATAIYARKLGLACHLVLFDQPVTAAVKRNLRLFHHEGAICHHAGGYAKTAWSVAREMAKSRLGDGPALFLVPPGGSSALGALGFVNAALELEDQVARGECPEPRYVFCALGSTGTYAGLVAGMKLTRLATRVVGVRVVDRVVANGAIARKFGNGAFALMREAGADIRDARVTDEDITILHDFFGGEYGRPTAAARDAVELAAAHGLTLETTYTGKAFAGMAAYLGDRSSRLGPVLFWHTYNTQPLPDPPASIDESIPPSLRRFLDAPEVTAPLTGGALRVDSGAS
ncbi:pyridoxal-phosphate dependent enzyme, partial [bacterium]|nr:pyridoxal-phosphate dependent enzyme [bacterium]